MLLYIGCKNQEYCTYCSFVSEKIFREINFLVTSLCKPLLSRFFFQRERISVISTFHEIFWQSGVSVKNFHIVVSRKKSCSKMTSLSLIWFHGKNKKSLHFSFLCGKYILRSILRNKHGKITSPNRSIFFTIR